MKTIITICGAFVLGVASLSFATPVLELDTNIETATATTNQAPLRFTRLNNAQQVPLGIEVGSQGAAGKSNTLSFSPNWTPPWYAHAPRVNSQTRWWIVRPPSRPPITVSSPPAPVPEPATMLLFGTGMVGIAMFGRKKLRK